MDPEWLIPEWPAPAAVRALFTTRRGGCSQGPWRSLNLGGRAGDQPAAVANNRRALRAAAGLPAEPSWLRQVHGARVVDLDQPTDPEPAADGAVSRAPARVCAVLTADCLPVLLCSRSGDRVGAVHAGWRGLAAGVLDSAVAALGPGADLLAWLGPAIGPDAFQVGDEVRRAFVASDPDLAGCFAAGGDGRWYADLFALARSRLNSAGVTAVYGGGTCTYANPERFFSYRRDGVTGRMAALIWRTGD